jgi:hypothetical protein
MTICLLRQIPIADRLEEKNDKKRFNFFSCNVTTLHTKDKKKQKYIIPCVNSVCACCVPVVVVLVPLELRMMDQKIGSARGGVCGG